MRILVPIGVLIVLVFAAYFGYFNPQPCDIDKEFFYCNTHPLTGIKILGTILFFLGGLSFAIVLGVFTWTSDKVLNFLIPFIVAVIGLIMIWA